MSTIRMLHENLCPKLDNVFGIVQFDNARVACCQPVAQTLFRAADDRRDFPQGIVEIQCDRPYAEHVLPTVTQ